VYLIEPYNAWGGPKKPKSNWQIAEEEFLIARLIAENQSSDANVSSPTTAGANEFYSYNFFHPSLTADFEISPATGEGPLEVTLINKSSLDAQKYAHFEWTINGTAYVSPPFPLIFHTGSNVVSLKAVVRDTSMTASATQSIVVTTPMPTASFTIGGPTSESGSGIISASIIVNTSGKAQSYLWYFGNGQTSSLETPITAYTASGTHSVSLMAMGYYNMTSSITNSFYALDLITEMSRSVIQMISPLTASSETYTLFSAIDDTTKTYTRNENLWASAVDWSCIPACNSDNGAAFNGVLVTPDIMIQANHAHAGGTMYFVDENNNTYSSSIISGSLVPGYDTDIYVAKLSPPLPSNIRPAKVLSSGSYIGSRAHILRSKIHLSSSIPIAQTNQYRTLRIGTLTSIGVPSAFASVWKWPYPTTEPWHSTIVSGDSGSPYFLIINGEPVAVATWYISSGGRPISNYIPEINTIIAALGSTSSLSYADLSNFIQYSQ
jgi:hypothetical protein